MNGEKQVKKRYALIGLPLRHSLSPQLHGALMQRKQLCGEYTLLEAKPQELPAVVARARQTLDGFNVTLPFKTEILPLLDGCDGRAARYGAVNTVTIRNGRAVGYNTDGEGFLYALSESGMALKGRVLIAGAGGAARVFALESVLHGAAVTLAVRASGMAKAMALQREVEDKTGVPVQTVLSDALQGSYDLLINATPLGMAPHPEGCPFDPKVIAAAGAVFDAVYRPAQTVLLRLAAEAGVPCAGGLPMLVGQAAAAQTIWNGITFDREDLAAVQKEMALYA